MHWYLPPDMYKLVQYETSVVDKVIIRLIFLLVLRRVGQGSNIGHKCGISTCRA